MTACYLTNDLFFSSRVISAANACGLDMSLVDDPSRLLARVKSGDVHFVLIDLSTPGIDLLTLVPDIRRQAASPVAIVAYGPHVNVAAVAAAKQAGCDSVYTRGQFNNQIVEILRQHGCTV